MGTEKTAAFTSYKILATHIQMLEKCNEIDISPAWSLFRLLKYTSLLFYWVTLWQSTWGSSSSDEATPTRASLLARVGADWLPHNDEQEVAAPLAETLSFIIFTVSLTQNVVKSFTAKWNEKPFQLTFDDISFDRKFIFMKDYTTQI